MTTTLSSALYRPEVWEDLAQTAFAGKVVISNYAMTDDTLVGQPGDTVDFPKWMNMTEMEDLAETDVLVPVKLTQSNSKATIKEAGKAVEWSDKAKLTGIGNVQDEAIRQFGIIAARKVDADLIAAGFATVTGGITYADGTAATNSAPLIYATGAGTGVAKLPYANIMGAVALLGDAFDPQDWAGIFVNSATWVNMMQDDKFINAAQMAGANQVINRGTVGSIVGVPVVVTDRLASGKAMMLKSNALGILWKRRPVVEQDRDILARTTVVATNMHYAVKRLDDKGVINITLTA